MSAESGVLDRPALSRRGVAVPAALRRVLRWPHLPGLSLQVALAAWLCRGFVGSAIPAGTDTLGFVARAASNARADTWLSAWSPESFGAPRTVTLESLLGLLTKLTGDPVTTVKLFMLATLVLSGVGTYWLTWRWYHRRLAAAVAGLLYMGSQISLAQTASGHLNVCVVLALAPLVIGLTVAGVERFSVWRAVGLGVALALLILARPDMALYVVPLAALYVPIRGLVERRFWHSMRNGLLTASVGLTVAIGLSLYEVVPMLGGIHAQWVSSGGLFNLQEFQARSVPALASLLGFAREIGYLAFTGRQTWTSHPWIGFGAYAALAAIPVAAAWAVLAWRRDARTLYLLTCAVLAAFAAKGMYGPLGEPYKWAAQHVPLFGNLRDPNRWLIVGSLAVAVLAGVAAARLPELLRWLDATRPARLLVVGAAVCMVALPNAPTILPGFATWRPTEAQSELLDAAAAAGRSPLATVPFDQTRRFMTVGSYQGWEHDLGAESSLWTGRPALADGGWSPSAASTIAYLNTLLGRRDPAFTPLLSALGVSDVLSFDYAPTAPHLVNPADPLYQQQAIATLHGLAAIRRTAAGSLLRVPAAAPVVSARPLRAVVLGGRSGLRALVRLHGLLPADWTAEDAADLITRGGVAGLAAAIRGADLVMVADAAPQEVAITAAPPLAQLPGISSDADRARATETLPPDVATRVGAALDESAAPPLGGAPSSRTSFVVHSAQPQAELWAQVRAVPNAATLRFTLDGRPLGALTPVAPAAAGFSWVRIGTAGLTAGGHRLGVSAAPSPYGSEYEINDVRLLAAANRRQAQQALTAALGAVAGRTAYAADLADALRTANRAQFAPGVAVGGGAGYWKALEPDRSSLGAGAGGVSLTFRSGRRYHALLAHYFRTPRNWASHAYAFLRVRGQASGAVFRILLDGDAHHRYTNQLVWTDRDAGWRWLALPLFANPGVARHVVSVRIAADDNAHSGRLELGALSLSPALNTVAVHLPIPVDAAARAEFVDQPHLGRGHGRLTGAARLIPESGGVAMHIPLNTLGAHYLVLAPPRGGVPRSAGPSLTWVRYGADRVTFTAHASRAFTLVLDRSQDPHWRLSGVRGAQPVRSWGTLQAWRLPAGSYRGTISYPGDRLVQLGAVASIVFAALVALALLFWPRRKPATVTDSPQPPDGDEAMNEHGPSRVPWSDWTWRAPWLVALALLIPIPFAISHGPGHAGNALAVAATAAMAIAVAAAALCSRRRCDDPDS
ncbi:MAG: hypothetical protein ACJ76X_19840 [Solirubrobacteraceae bacterium]